MAAKDVRIAIIGGGIGGLTAAISLLQAGFDVQVYEQSRLLSEVGAGINIGPNASRLLIRLGLGEECARVAYRSPFFHQRRWDDGRTLTKTPLGEAIAKEFGAPHMHLPSRRAACAAGQGGAAGARASGASLHRRRAGRRWRDGHVRERRRRHRRRCADRRRRHLLGGPPHLARAGAPAVRLPRLSRADPGRTGARHSAGIDGVARPRPALRPLFRLGRPDAEFRRPCRAGGLDQRILDRAGQRRRSARRLRGLASAGSAHHRRGRRDLHLGGARPPADRRAGPTAASRCWATPAIR